MTRLQESQGYYKDSTNFIFLDYDSGSIYSFRGDKVNM